MLCFQLRSCCLEVLEILGSSYQASVNGKNAGGSERGCVCVRKSPYAQGDKKRFTGHEHVHRERPGHLTGTFPIIHRETNVVHP